MALFSSTAVFISLGLLASYVVYLLVRPAKDAAPLPPGPKGLPLVGNLGDLPPAGVLECHHWAKHKDVYGPISSVTVFGQTFIIINDAGMALELLRDRANSNSGRPHQEFSSNMIGWKESLAFLQPNDVFKIQRKNFAKVASSAGVTSVFDRVQEEESVHFLNNILDDPDALWDHIRKEAGAVISRITYDYTPQAKGKDPLIDLVQRCLHEFGDACVPGRWSVDIMPWLQYLPDWFPGTGFKAVAKRYRKTLEDSLEIPYRLVRKQLRDGTHGTSFLSQIIQDGAMSPEMESTHKWTAFALFAGGSDTTVAALMTFFLGVLMHPEVQVKAQEEIDRVTGGSRLPVSSDKPNLKYIEAIVWETHRWHPVGPMGLPHTSEADQVFRGYRIPKGSLILPNSWWFTHDPARYADPMAFRPERYFDTPTHKAEPDPRVFGFGYGRRVCPGRNIADNALLITIAQTLAVFKIEKPVERGVTVEPTMTFEPGVISHPTPYKANITPRSEKHREMIRDAEKLFPYGEANTKQLAEVGFF